MLLRLIPAEGWCPSHLLDMVSIDPEGPEDTWRSRGSFRCCCWSEKVDACWWRTSEHTALRAATALMSSVMMKVTSGIPDLGSVADTDHETFPVTHLGVRGSNLWWPPRVASPVDRKQLPVTSKWLHLSNPYGSYLFVSSVDWLKHQTRRYADSDFQTISQSHFSGRETRTTKTQFYSFL